MLKKLLELKSINEGDIDFATNLPNSTFLDFYEKMIAGKATPKEIVSYILDKHQFGKFDSYKMTKTNYMVKTFSDFEKEIGSFEPAKRDQLRYAAVLSSNIFRDTPVKDNVTNINDEALATELIKQVALLGVQRSLNYVLKDVKRAISFMKNEQYKQELTKLTDFLQYFQDNNQPKAVEAFKQIDKDNQVYILNKLVDSKTPSSLERVQFLARVIGNEAIFESIEQLINFRNDLPRVDISRSNPEESTIRDLKRLTKMAEQVHDVELRDQIIDTWSRESSGSKRTTGVFLAMYYAKNDEALAELIKEHITDGSAEVAAIAYAFIAALNNAKTQNELYEIAKESGRQQFENSVSQALKKVLAAEGRKLV